MLGSSRTSMALIRETVDGKFEDPELGAAGRDLLAITDVLAREKSLRQTLADSGRTQQDRSGIVRRLFGGQVCGLAEYLASQIVELRWGSDADMLDAFEATGASALLGEAEKQGQGDRVEEDLFRFARILDANGDLQLTLASSSVAPEVKNGVVHQLLDGKVSDTTIELVVFTVNHLRGRRVDAALEDLVKLAAVRRGQVSATVRSATPLAEDQRQRLAAVLERIYGRPVQLSLDVDPELMGGLSVQVGDEIIDGTIATRLNNARRRLAG